MRYIMRRICLSLVMIAVIVFAGCGQKKKEDPITVTLWHVYGGQTESPLNDLIDEFNETVGKEKKYTSTGWQCYKIRNTIHEKCAGICIWRSGSIQTAGYVCFLSEDSSGYAG